MLNGFLRRYVFSPLKYSFSGLKFALQDRAFSFEILLGLFFFPFLAVRFWHTLELLLLSLGYFIILIAETINCAIEQAVDLASPEIHPLAKRAKDIASAAVLLALFNFALILIYSFFN
ncbi:MAG: diacylglycerol kinase [Puniceicoccales bacterium]|jgi:diacylglycerol kinase (ATP)|nr:diacylglycerol kinase [Puniceicoccales bacterium]